MKTKFFIIAALIIPMAAMGQIIQRTVPEVKVTPPVFTGIQNVTDLPVNVDRQIDIYLTKNFQYPANASKYGEQGTGIVRFVVKTNGELTDFHIINSVGPIFDNELIRVVKTTEGMWRPGSNNGNPVEMEKEVSMRFVANLEWCNNKPVEYFLRLAKVNFEKGNNLFLKKSNPEKALKFYDNSIKYLPRETSSLLLRGLCRYELGNQEGACSDWNRINEIGKYNATEFIINLCGLKGYEEMVEILKK